MKARDYIPALKFGHKIYPEDTVGLNEIPPYVNEFWYVDATNGGDGGVGNAEDNAFATVQKAMDEANDYDYITVLPGTYTENLLMGLVGTGKNITLKGTGMKSGWADALQCTLLGTGDQTSPIITVRERGWRITGFRIAVCGSSQSIVLDQDQAGTTVGTTMTEYTQIDNNYFWLNQDDISLSGYPHGIKILNNHFVWTTNRVMLNDGGAVFKAMNDCLIAGNFFNDVDNGIYFDVGGFSQSVITGNYFSAKGCTKKLYNGVGGSNVYNIIGGNYFGGTYSKSGGYEGHSTDDWGGNYNSLSGGVTAADPA